MNVLFSFIETLCKAASSSDSGGTFPTVKEDLNVIHCIFQIVEHCTVASKYHCNFSASIYDLFSKI
jgi:hypothetical protein